MFKPGDVLKRKQGSNDDCFIVQRVELTHDVGQMLSFTPNLWALAESYEHMKWGLETYGKNFNVGEYVARADGVNPSEHFHIEEVNGRAIRIQGVWHLDIQFQTPFYKALNNPFSIGDMVVCVDPCGSLREGTRYVVTNSDTTCIQIDNSTTRAKFGRFKMVCHAAVPNTNDRKERVEMSFLITALETNTSPKLISVHFPGGGKLYTYYTELDVEIGDTVVVPNGLNNRGKYKLATVRGVELDVSKTRRGGLKQVVDVVNDHDHSHCNKRVTRLSGYETSYKQIQANLKSAELLLRNALGMQGMNVNRDQLMLIAEHNNIHSRARDLIRYLKHKLASVERDITEAGLF